jgi:hypothetical protein
LLNQLQPQMELVTRTLGAIVEHLDKIEERSNIDEN